MIASALLPVFSYFWKNIVKKWIELPTPTAIKNEGIIADGICQGCLNIAIRATIESIDAVSKARVHLVMPKQSLFVTEERPATASVIMELVHPLNAKQAEGIVHLVAAAVEGLDESQVTLLDQKGNLVAGGQQASKDGRMGADESMDMQKQVEKSLENRAQAMLDMANYRNPWILHQRFTGKTTSRRLFQKISRPSGWNN